MANIVWKEFEKQFIRDNAALLTDELGAAKLSQVCGRDVSVHAYRKKRQEMKLRKKPGRGKCELADARK
jgi:hypothetical protein